MMVNNLTLWLNGLDTRQPRKCFFFSINSYSRKKAQIQQERSNYKEIKGRGRERQERERAREKEQNRIEGVNLYFYVIKNAAILGRGPA